VGQGEADTHRVRLDAFHISAYETTYAEQDLWAAFTGSKPVRHIRAHSDTRTPQRPAGTRTWQEAKDYCTWLGEVTGLAFDLPTEAQWEYAARNRGDKIPYATYNGRWKDPETFENGNWKDDPQYLGHGEFSQEYPPPDPPLPVDTYPPNELGLYDMTGNVHEWADDWYTRDYYQRSPVDNPQDPDDGQKKILRGGAHEQTDYCNTVYSRYPRDPVPGHPDLPIDLMEIGFGNYGFRCTLDLERELESGELVERARQRGYLDGG